MFVCPIFFSYLCGQNNKKRNNMCLIADLKKPIMAERDIVVYKVLIKTMDDIKTPVMGKTVNLNSVLEADTDFPYELGEYSLVESGAIHAWTSPFRFGNYNALGIDYGITVMYKAIIKKGTPFYYSYDIDAVAAKNLYVTDEVAWRTGNNNDLLEYLAEERKHGLPYEHENVRIGDICLSDDTFVNVDEINTNDNALMNSIKGVVGFFKNGNPVIIGLYPALCVYNYNKSPEDIIDETTDGEEITKNLIEEYNQYIDCFPAIKYCKDYKSTSCDNGGWYLPSLNELDNIRINDVVIDNALRKIGAFFQIKNRLFFASNECDTNNVLVSEPNERLTAWYLHRNIYALPCQTIKK